jgi:hypothetical protein
MQNHGRYNYDVEDSYFNMHNQEPSPQINEMLLQHFLKTTTEKPTPTKDVTQATLTLKELGGLLIVLGSVLFSAFSAWNNINNDIDSQKNDFAQFKIQITKQIEDITISLKQITKLQEDSRKENQLSNEAMNSRIQELDTTISQIYQKVSSK